MLETIERVSRARAEESPVGMTAVVSTRLETMLGKGVSNSENGLPAKLHVEYWPLSRLRLYERNPRRNDAAVDRMVASIREFGFAVPCLATSDGECIDGHLRAKAAAKMGMAEVPVIPCDGWTDAQVKAFRLMVNRSVGWAEWDDGLLALELSDLSAMNFKLELTGFNLAELDKLMDPPALIDPNDLWQGMPEFQQDDQSPQSTLYVHFKNEQDRQAFSGLVGQPLTEKTKYIWYPQAEIGHYANKAYVQESA